MKAILAKPRGFCAGVERAIRVVEMALEHYGAPIYVRKEIVHNSHVVRRLREAGAVFVEELDDVPDGAVAILSAHGSPPEVYRQAEQRDLRVIDATCPLVTKVHKEVHRFVREDYRIVLIGHAGHDEVVGTMGEAPQHTVLVETVEEAERLELPAEEKGVILTQTTLSQDDTRDIVAVLRRRFANLELPPTDDICYATQNRQNAIKEISDAIDLLLVVGSPNSSNSLRLTEVAKARGIPAHLIDGPGGYRRRVVRGRGNGRCFIRRKCPRRSRPSRDRTPTQAWRLGVQRSRRPRRGRSLPPARHRLTHSRRLLQGRAP